MEPGAKQSVSSRFDLTVRRGPTVRAYFDVEAKFSINFIKSAIAHWCKVNIFYTDSSISAIHSIFLTGRPISQKNIINILEYKSCVVLKQ